MNVYRRWSAWLVAAAGVLGLVVAEGSVNAQGAYLQVKSVATSEGLTHPQRLSTTGDTAESAYNRTETLQVTVQNTQSAPADYVVEWQFLAKDVATKKNYIYDRGTTPVALTSGSYTNFVVQSRPLAESEIQRYEYGEDDDGNSIMVEVGNREKSGAKPAGYVFLVKAHGKLIAVEASDRDLKEPYLKELAAKTFRPAP